MDTYTFPTSKLVSLTALRTAATASSATPSQGTATVTAAVIVSCGSYNPIHSAHVDMFHRAKAAIERATAASDGARSQGATVVVGAYCSPVNDGYAKPGLAPFSLRYQLCEAVLQNDPFVAVDSWEGLQPEFVRSYYVLQHVRECVRDFYAKQLTVAEEGGVLDLTVHVHVFFLCGADLFETFYRDNCWKLSLLRKIFEEFRLVVCTRAQAASPADVIRTRVDPITSTSEPGESLDLTPFASSIVVFELPPNETSSTAIRRYIEEDRIDAIPSTMLPPEAIQFLHRNPSMYGRSKMSEA